MDWLLAAPFVARKVSRLIQVTTERLPIVKRLLSLTSVCLLALPAYVGCDRESTTTETQTISTPEGETTMETTTTLESSGDNPPTVNGNSLPPETNP
jgi:hypothetical protein